MTEQEMNEQAAAKEAAENEKYLKEKNNLDSLDNLVQAAENYKKGVRKEIWPTGFAKLDEALDGGFHGSQLLCLGAISSLGKSTWCLQIATQMAELGKDVLIFSLEMSRDELNAKTISRYSHMLTLDAIRRLNANTDIKTEFTTFEVLKGEVFSDYPETYESFMRSVDKARSVAGHIYIHVGNNDVSVDEVAATVRRHILATGNKPAVFIDYLQILNPSKESTEKRYDVRRSTNDDITKLKVLARNEDIPVVVVSAFNRASYTETVSMSSFRESSGIEYSSDVLFGLQYQGMDYQEGFFTQNNQHGKGKESQEDHNTRVSKLFEDMQILAAEGKAQPIELKILKNRNGSKATLPFKFTPKFNYYEEEQPESFASSNPTQRGTKKRSASVNF